MSDMTRFISKNCALYFRCASVDGIEAALLLQRDECEKAAARLGLTVTEEHIFIDSSCTALQADRPALNRLLDPLRSADAPFRDVIMADPARLSRGLNDSLRPIQLFEQGHTRLHFALIL
jgi:DNA invertase Pin-like site-specific DNA recombinase